MAQTKLSTSSPGYIGCFMAIAVGCAMVLLGGYLLFKGASSMPLKIALVLLGATNALLGLLGLQANRVAWSFALSLNGTLGVVFLFGAPKVRDAADIHLAIAIAPAFLFGITTTLLALSGRDFEK